MEHSRTNDDQCPYRPYFGPDYRRILFAGINLNGSEGGLTAIADLVDKAKKYLGEHKYLIFKSKLYGGSPFYYYVPLLAYLYNLYYSGKPLVKNYTQITFEQVIEGFRYCALTNLIKCSVASADRRSTPSEAMYRNCINKFTQELKLIDYQVLVVFTLFRRPTLADGLGRHEMIGSGPRHRIQSIGRSYLLELEHPLSTRVSKANKFSEYSGAMFDLARIVRTATSAA